MNGRHAASDTDRPDDESILELTDGENPLTFLSMAEPDTALGLISWMDDHDRIEGWRRAEIESDGKPRKTILKALEKQKRALEADATLPIYHDQHRRSTKIADADTDHDFEPTPEPDATADPIAATDGGTTPDSPPEPEGSTEPDTSDEPDPIHPDVKGLAAGEVLVLDRGDSTEYIFPATPEADRPYLLRAFDDEDGERTAEPIGLTFDEVLSRLDGGPDPTAIGDVDVRPPTDAATNGGAD